MAILYMESIYMATIEAAQPPGPPVIDAHRRRALLGPTGMVAGVRASWREFAAGAEGGGSAGRGGGGGGGGGRGGAAAWAADCAERVVAVFEAEAPGDDRPRDATRAFARGELGAAGEIRR